MKVAAYQAPLLPAGSMDSLGLIRTRVEWCEAEGSQFTFAAMAILLVAVALVASYLPARRAARVDPIASLAEQ